MKLLILWLLFFSSCQTEFEDEFCPDLNNCSDSTDATPSSPTTTLVPFFLDDFNRANGGIATSANWNIVFTGTDIDIDSTSVIIIDTNGGNPPAVALYTTILTQADAEVSIDMDVIDPNYNTTGNIVHSIFLRNTLNTNFRDVYGCGIDEPGNGNLELILYKLVNGVFTLLAQSTGSSVPFNNSDNYNLKLRTEGTALTCSITGSVSISITATDSTFSAAGYAGFGGGNDGADKGVEIDNFTISTIQ